MDREKISLASSALKSHRKFIENALFYHWGMIKELALLLLKNIGDEEVANTVINQNIPAIDSIRESITLKHSPFRNHEYQLPFQLLQMLKSMKSTVSKLIKKPVNEIKTKDDKILNEPKSFKEKRNLFETELAKQPPPPLPIKSFSKSPKDSAVKPNNALDIFDKALMSIETENEPLKSILTLKTPASGKPIDDISPTSSAVDEKLPKRTPTTLLPIHVRKLEEELLPESTTDITFSVEKGRVIRNSMLIDNSLPSQIRNAKSMDIFDDNFDSIISKDSPIVDLASTSSELAKKRSELRKSMLMGDFSIVSELTNQIANLNGNAESSRPELPIDESSDSLSNKVLIGEHQSLASPELSLVSGIAESLEKSKTASSDVQKEAPIARKLTDKIESLKTKNTDSIDTMMKRLNSVWKYKSKEKVSFLQSGQQEPSNEVIPSPPKPTDVDVSILDNYENGLPSKSKDTEAENSILDHYEANMGLNPKTKDVEETILDHYETAIHPANASAEACTKPFEPSITVPIKAAKLLGLTGNKTPESSNFKGSMDEIPPPTSGISEMVNEAVRKLTNNEPGMKQTASAVFDEEYVRIEKTEMGEASVISTVVPTKKKSVAVESFEISDLLPNNDISKGKTIYMKESERKFSQNSNVDVLSVIDAYDSTPAQPTPETITSRNLTYKRISKSLTNIALKDSDYPEMSKFDSNTPSPATVFARSPLHLKPKTIKSDSDLPLFNTGEKTQLFSDDELTSLFTNLSTEISDPKSTSPEKTSPEKDAPLSKTKSISRKKTEKQPVKELLDNTAFNVSDPPPKIEIERKVTKPKKRVVHHAFSPGDEALSEHDTKFSNSHIYDPDHKSDRASGVLSSPDLYRMELAPMANSYQIILVPLNAMFDLCIHSLQSPLRLGRNNSDNCPNFKAFGSLVVSRNHAEIYVEDGQTFIKDFGSTSGTFRNDARLSKPSNESPNVMLHTGDYIQLGKDFNNDDQSLDSNGRIPSRRRCVKFQVVIIPPTQVSKNCVMGQSIPIEQSFDKTIGFNGIEIFTSDEEIVKSNDQKSPISPNIPESPVFLEKPHRVSVTSPVSPPTLKNRQVFALEVTSWGTKTKRVQIRKTDGSMLIDTILKRWEDRGLILLQETWADGTNYLVQIQEKVWPGMKKQKLNIQNLIDVPFEMMSGDTCIGTIVFKSDIKLELTPMDPTAPIVSFTGDFKESRFILYQRSHNSRKQELIGGCKGKHQTKKISAFESTWLSSVVFDITQLQPLIIGGLSLLGVVGHA